NDVLFHGVEYPLHDRVLAIQRVALKHMFDPEVLGRIQNNSLKADKDEQPLTVAEVFRCLTEGIWIDLPIVAQPAKRTLTTSIIRRNLQREHVKDLIQV